MYLQLNPRGSSQANLILDFQGTHLMSKEGAFDRIKTYLSQVRLVYVLAGNRNEFWSVISQKTGENWHVGYFLFYLTFTSA